MYKISKSDKNFSSFSFSGCLLLKLLKFIKRRGQNKWGAGIGISKNPLILVMNEKRDKCSILMLKLKVSKKTKSEVSKNKVSNNQNSIKHIKKLSKSK